MRAGFLTALSIMGLFLLAFLVPAVAGYALSRLPVGSAGKSKDSLPEP